VRFDSKISCLLSRNLCLSCERLCRKIRRLLPNFRNNFLSTTRSGLPTGLYGGGIGGRTVCGGGGGGGNGFGVVVGAGGTTGTVGIDGADVVGVGETTVLGATVEFDPGGSGDCNAGGNGGGVVMGGNVVCGVMVDPAGELPATGDAGACVPAAPVEVAGVCVPAASGGVAGTCVPIPPGGKVVSAGPGTGGTASNGGITVLVAGTGATGTGTGIGTGAGVG
jgi:hypothetical protein